MAEGEARKFLEFILHSRVATMEEKKAEFAARAVDPGDQPAIMAAHEVQTEEEAADRQFPAFHAALRALGGTRRDGAPPLVLDDADPQQNALADAVVRFLVKPQLAAVETEEAGAEHFRYRVTVDWPAMQRTATLAGVDLNALLA
ncbi:MAG TPA: hypothetical protein VM536_13345 [Chloroflexia bacterium]|nr:hypothetical protein [Chloroflexia bacterium]